MFSISSAALRRGFFAFIACFLVAWPLAARADRELHGVVLDRSGAPIADATVSTQNAADGTAMTGASGTFTLHVTTTGPIELRVRTALGLVAMQRVASDLQSITITIATSLKEIGSVAVHHEAATSTLTHVDAPLKDQPVDIASVDDATLQQRDASTLGRSLDTVSGVQTLTAFDNQVYFQVRGILGSGNTFRDGFFQPNTPSDDTINIARIDVLKGPAAALLGASAPLAGAVNIVTKEPTQQPVSSAEVEAGSYAMERAAFDVGGPIVPGILAYRLTGSYDRSNSFREFVSDRSATLAPSLLWTPDTRTSIRISYEGDRTAYTYDAGAPLGNPLVLSLPQSLSYAEPGDRTTALTSSLTEEYRRTLSKWWQIREAYNQVDYHIDFPYNSTRWYTASFEPGGTVLDRQLDVGPQVASSNALQLGLVGNLTTGAVTHHVAFDLANDRSFYDYINLLRDAPPLNLLGPVYGPLTTPATPYADGAYDTNTFGIGANDLIELTSKVKVSLGGRYDFAGSGSVDRLGGSASAISQNRFDPRVGIVYEPSKTVSLFSDYGESLQTQGGILADGSAAPPQVAHQVELGVKEEIGSRLSATLAAYHIVLDNVLTADPNAQGFSTPAGQVQSRGVEFDLRSSLTRSLSITAAYALSDARVARDNSLPEGNREVGVPRNSGSIWLYERADGMHGVSLGLGVFAHGSEEVSLPNTFQIPAMARLDGSFGVPLGSSTFRVNVDNLTGIRDFQTDGGYTLLPLAPRTIRVGISTRTR